MNKIYLNTIGTPCKAGGGGNSGGSTGGENWVYYADTSGYGLYDRPMFLQVCHMAKIFSEINNLTMVQSCGGINGWPSDFIIKAVGINLNARVGQGNDIMTVAEFIELNKPMFDGWLGSAATITESEFYTL